MKKSFSQVVTMTGRGIAITDPIRKYVIEKLEKQVHYLVDATKIDVIFEDQMSHKGVAHDFRGEIVVAMPKAVIRVEEHGSDVYVIIDKLDPVLKRRLERYSSKRNNWEDIEPWKIKEAEKMEKEIGDDDTTFDSSVDLTPLIRRYKQYSDNSPIPLAEAIERMELLGYPAFLFRNSETNKYAMIYKTGDGHYGLVEPKEG